MGGKKNPEFSSFYGFIFLSSGDSEGNGLAVSEGVKVVVWDSGSFFKFYGLVFFWGRLREEDEGGVRGGEEQWRWWLRWRRR